MKKKEDILCIGKQGLINKNSLGGHIEDYTTDPQDKTPFPKDMKWVPVSESFKKS